MQQTSLDEVGDRASGSSPIGKRSPVGRSYHPNNEIDLSGKLLIKARLNLDIRKILIHFSESILYAELVLMLQRMFDGPDESLHSSSRGTEDDFIIRYRDEDGDLVTIHNDTDLEVALFLCKPKLDLVITRRSIKEESVVNDAKQSDDLSLGSQFDPIGVQSTQPTKEVSRNTQEEAFVQKPCLPFTPVQPTTTELPKHAMFTPMQSQPPTPVTSFQPVQNPNTQPFPGFGQFTSQPFGGQESLQSQINFSQQPSSQQNIVRPFQQPQQSFAQPVPFRPMFQQQPPPPPPLQNQFMSQQNAQQQPPPHWGHDFNQQMR
ncbi:hypothetical protein ACOME3_006359 [Neoechinorhynchus agilis]